ncbi:hypothetical protein P691DRAFT_779542 [Macrolepiota fuliginosa MF-IS2]|uniref:FZ domain-containing protein n=1 Tax=Macrolepiota fuliginosa MF-IS2 TaxID=1400762 RepID=A0A9P5X2F4_9AGAR|nr:hypothetical protein P691DRAFT_779583 [Macrolepiota fuliginosa MF-IS2]KAF9442137.1 hypothetical protein P691DRAFT_779542 [Macrolepiota fuliginosa MF-IS2]
MLPTTLLLLISLVLSSNAQTRTALSLNTVTRSSQTSFSIPGQDKLTITLALCSSASPRFFISNSTNNAIERDPGPDGGEDVREIDLKDGFGSWTGAFPSGGVLAVEGLPPGASFEVGISNDSPLHEIISTDPLFGDSTSNQAILFSHNFTNPLLIASPQYPNYTLPAANSSLPDPPSSPPNLTLIVTQTSSTSLLRTACFLNSSAVSTTGAIVNSSLWLRGPQDGWRTEYLLGGLTPSTNYTAFIIQDSHKVSGPINFLTKSASFACTLIHALPFCPSTTYALPLPAPPNTEFPIYDASTIPTEISTQLIGVLSNFTTSLTTFACGRDWYSPLVGCDDCQREYRKWLCTTIFPRCTEPSPSNPTFLTPNPSSIGLTNAGPTPTSTPSNQQVFSALLPIPTSQSPSDRLNLPYMSSPYTQLLPCIETCTSVDRACPPFLGFRCPSVMFNGASSYGFGYIDGAEGDERGGVAGVAQDRWGNIWCNTG